MSPNAEADVCLVVEGCYPFISGGVSSWLDWLIRTQPDRSFALVALTADDRDRDRAFELPPNVVRFQSVGLEARTARPGLREPDMDGAALAGILHGILVGGELDAFDALIAFLAAPIFRRPFAQLSAPAPPTPADLMSSETAWTALVECYGQIAPSAAFADFFWAWRNLVGGLVSVMAAPLPPARTYHAISTGYAGLVAARAARETGRPAVITEHGIYTNERRIDLVMADWIADHVETGLAGDAQRADVRDFYMAAFEAFARIAYEATARITTLYGANQSFQRALGAREDRLRVIPNGIALERFAHIRPAPKDRPTVALIGRVVPIKDIEAYVAAARIVRDAVPDVRILVIGPTDEEPDYDALCRRRVTELGLEDTVEFTGRVDIADYLPLVDVLTLTSISEAQPLVILEAGAAGIPCVATDVGSCREIIEGAPDESPRLGLAGRVAPPMDAAAIAAGIVALIGDADERRRCGEVMRARVKTYFTSELSAARYGALYDELIA